jgi:S1-C subfamily serine protease
MEIQSVVRIFATTQSPSYQTPWEYLAPSSGTGSGVVIAPNKILTGAHVVANSTFLQVQKVSDPDKIVARVAAICHDSDLALLEVDDESFMEGIHPEELGQLPSLRDRVSVVGYPVGGEEISITEGVVSRLEVQRYSHSERMALAVTVDAAINDGNSGGPVFLDGKVAGIAFQSLKEAENIGEMVPTTLISKFLEGTKKNLPPRVPGLGMSTQSLENPLLRRQAGLSAGQSGVLVLTVEHGGAAWGHIEVGDVMMAIDGQSIANNATIRYAGRFRTTFDVVLGDHYIGDDIIVTVLRGGEVVDLTVKLKPYAALVPRSQYDRAPIYFVYGGLVFQPLSLDFLRTWRDWWEKAPPEFLHAYYSGTRTAERNEVVMLTHVLADEINIGYEPFDQTTITQVNGVQPANMIHFVQLVDAASDRLELRTSDHCVIALDVAEARDAGPRILERYHVPSDRSDDLANMD